MDDPIEVVFVDDDVFMRRALREVLSEPGNHAIRFVGEAATSAEALALVEEHVPDVLLADLKLTFGEAAFSSGLQLIHQTRQISPQTQVLVLTAFDEPEHLLRALQAGANGYMLKGDVNGPRLRDGLSVVASGQPYYSPVVFRLINEVLRRPIADQNDDQPFASVSLTSRELDVLALIADGRSNQEIADALIVSIKTVKTHVSNILAKLQLKSRYQAAEFYRSRHL